MHIRAAVATSPGEPFAIEDLELDPPRADEVLVRILAVGICRTDLHIRDQEYPVPLPAVPGHEGAGIVEAVGSAVTGLHLGDHVVLSFPSCGHCAQCLAARPAYCAHGFALSFGAQRLDATSALRRADGKRVNGHIFQQSSFATHAVCPARNAVKVPADLPLEVLAPLACGVQTGAGTVLNTLALRPGQSLAVIGAGGVGLSAVMAAAVCGAAPILAVEPNPRRRKLALELGATAALDPSGVDLAEALTELAGGPLDAIIDTAAVPAVFTAAIPALDMTGTLALVGAAAAGVRAEVDLTTLLNGRILRGVIQGDAIPRLTIARLIELYRTGRLPLESLIGYYDFDDINAAVSDMLAGSVIKPVLRVGHAGHQES